MFSLVQNSFNFFKLLLEYILQLALWRHDLNIGGYNGNFRFRGKLNEVKDNFICVKYLLLNMYMFLIKWTDI